MILPIELPPFHVSVALDGMNCMCRKAGVSHHQQPRNHDSPVSTTDFVDSALPIMEMTCYSKIAGCCAIVGKIERKVSTLR